MKTSLDQLNLSPPHPRSSGFEEKCGTQCLPVSLPSDPAKPTLVPCCSHSALRQECMRQLRTHSSQAAAEENEGAPDIKGEQEPEGILPGPLRGHSPGLLVWQAWTHCPRLSGAPDQPPSHAVSSSRAEDGLLPGNDKDPKGIVQALSRRKEKGEMLLRSSISHNHNADDVGSPLPTTSGQICYVAHLLESPKQTFIWNKAGQLFSRKPLRGEKPKGG
ncbi:uncharacterized protein LOC123521918 [Echinops telfairi]|uniref:Uncharacterized protein LOC123521918 n=1 Tax=Echinops telfairi TaxID=9371 RepID=A0AC55D8Y4_ECHTE|nr:uncharacterized protein LOC123521918 [Echinops telfairi]